MADRGEGWAGAASAGGARNVEQMVLIDMEAARALRPAFSQSCEQIMNPRERLNSDVDCIL